MERLIQYMILAASLCIGNYLYQVLTDGDWLRASERCFFQISAVFTC